MAKKLRSSGKTRLWQRCLDDILFTAAYVSSSFIWTCRLNFLHTAITIHRFVARLLWAQNLPIQKIFSTTCSAIVCYFLLHWYRDFRPFSGFICSSAFNVVYRVPATGARSPRIAYRQSLWLADMWHAYWAAGFPSNRRQNQNGVNV